MDQRAALRIERDMLAALVAAARRGRPEIVARLRLVTTELLRLELEKQRQDAPSTAFGGPPPPSSTGEDPGVSDRTRWWDR